MKKIQLQNKNEYGIELCSQQNNYGDIEKEETNIFLINKWNLVDILEDLDEEFAIKAILLYLTEHEERLEYFKDLLNRD